MTRKEALDVLRKNIPTDKSLPVYEALQTLIPELRESEDERILRVISEAVITFFSDYANDFEDEDRDAALAWLEKQKEQKSKAKAKSPLSPHELYDAKIEGISQGRQDVLDHPEQFGLQKPAEWSEEALNVMNLVYRCIRKVLAEFAVYTENEELLESREETVCYYSQRCAEKILKSLRPSWKPSEDELTKKHLEGYIKGRNDALREMSDFMESHFNTQSGTSIKSGGNK